MQRSRVGKDGSPSNVKTEYRMKEGLIFLHNVFESLTKSNPPFQDIFNNYNEYWELLTQGKSFFCNVSQNILKTKYSM